MDTRRLTVIIVPDGDPETRTYRVPYGRVKLALGVAAVVVVVFVVMAASWWFVAAQAARVPGLERQVSELEAERQKVAELARTLSEVEAQYERVRTMLGADAAGGTDARGRPLLPPLVPGADSAGSRDGGGGAAPRPRDDGAALTPEAGGGPGTGPLAGGGPRLDGWPLAAPGFVTRALTGAGARPGSDGDGSRGGDHPGIDIAVPADTYVRAVGAGTVLEADSDDVYGDYVLLDHGGGLQTLYGHASRLFVRAGERVEAHQVIALSGSTGRSTAPHLHFEVRRNGRPVDPMNFVSRP